MLINAVSYLGIVIALLLMRPQPVIEYGPRLSLLNSIREGLSFIRGDPVLRWVVVLSVATALFTHPDCVQHEMGEGHPESPLRLKAVLKALLQQ